MRRGTLLGAAIGLGALAWSSVALAQPIDVIDYQGRLVDAGSPAAGQYDVRFRLYDQEVGGTMLAEHTSTVVIPADANGVFHATDLPFAAFFNGEARWMELGVTPQGGSLTVLDPRQPVTLSPHAAYAQRSGTTLQQAFTNGSVIDTTPASVHLTGTNGIDVDSTFDVGGPVNGLFRLYAPFTANPIVSFRNDGTRGGRVDVRDTANNNVVVTQVDPNGGGQMSIARDSSGSTGFLVDGNAGGSASTRVDLTGEARSIVLDTSVGGDAAVVLPDGAIDAHEMFDEPGVAERHANSLSTDIDSFVSAALSRTISVPGPGYVLAMGNAEVLVGFVNGSDQGVNVGLSDKNNAFYDGIELSMDIPGGRATGSYNLLFSPTMVFPVTAAGSYTFYLVASEDGGQGANIVRVSDAQITLLYVPTAYGTVGTGVTLLQGSGAVPDGFGPGRGPLTAQEIAAEQTEELRRQNAVLVERQRELERRLDEQQRRLDTLIRASSTDR